MAPVSGDPPAEVSVLPRAHAATIQLTYEYTWWQVVMIYAQAGWFGLFAWGYLALGAYLCDKPWAQWLFFDANKERLCGTWLSWLWCF